MAEVVLYDYWRSSAAYRLRITFNLLGIAYRAVPVDLLTGEHKAADYLARNAQGLVPTVEIDGTTLTQSLAILEYLHETRPDTGLLPEDAPGRARVRRLSYAIAMEIHPVCNVSVVKYAAAESGGAISMESWMQVFIPDRLAAFETMLAEPETGHYCHGGRVSMADICLVPQVYNARRWKIDLAPLPKIRNIMARLEALPAVAAAHPDRHKPA